MSCCKSDVAAQKQELDDLDAEERELRCRVDSLRPALLESRKLAKQLKQQLVSYEAFLEQLKQYTEFQAEKLLLEAAQRSRIDDLHDLLRYLESGGSTIEKEAVLGRLQAICGGIAPFGDAPEQPRDADADAGPV